MSVKIKLTQAIQLHSGARSDRRLFRNNVGTAWMSNSYKILQGGDVLLKNARRVAYGLCVGSGDLIGWKSVVITPEMVGKTIAQFTSIEVKEGKDKPSKEQLAFLAAVAEAGGLCGIARSTEDAEAIFL